MFYSKPWADALIVLLVALLFFGPKRLPTLGRSLGQGFREFKDGITGGHKDDEEGERAALPRPATADQPAGSAAEQQPPLPAEPPASSGEPMPSNEPASTSPAHPPESAEVGSSEPRS